MRRFRTLLMGFCLSMMSWPAIAADHVSHALRWVVAYAEPVPTPATLTAEHGLRPDVGGILVAYDLTLKPSAMTAGEAERSRLSGFTATSYDLDTFDGCRDAFHRPEVRPAGIAGSPDANHFQVAALS